MKAKCFAVALSVLTVACGTLSKNVSDSAVVASKPSVQKEFRIDRTSDILDEGSVSGIGISISGPRNNWSDYSFDRDKLGISFTSSDTNVVSVNKTGIITANSRGRADVNVTSAKTGQSVNYSIRVVEKDERTFLDAGWEWKDLGKGAQCAYADMNIFDSVQSISIARYPDSAYGTYIQYNTGENCATTEKVAVESGGVIAINGSYFDTKILTSIVTFMEPGGKFVTNMSANVTERCTGALGIDPAGRITIFPYVEEEKNVWPDKFATALASGPLLMQEGSPEDFKDNSFNETRHPRSMIGITKDRMVYLVVVDGRFPGKAAGMSIPELAKIAQYLELDSALNLDGGGSSTLWTKQHGVLNHPSDNKKWDHRGLRKDPTVIVVR